MRFLALHGSGTNNAVFESQTAAFRYKLGEEHTFEFLEAPHPWRIAPGKPLSLWVVEDVSDS